MCVYLVIIISTVFLFYKVLVFIARKLRPGVLVFVVRLIESENHVLMAAKEGIRKKKTIIKVKTSQSQKQAFFPIAKKPTIVRAAQLAVLELLKQPEGMYHT